MNKGPNKALFVLIFLLLACLTFAGYSVFEKQKVEQAKALVDQELEQTQEREKNKAAEIQKLGGDIKKVQDEKSRLEDKLKQAEAQAEDLNKQVTQAKEDADSVRQRLDGARKERDDLLAKVQQLTTDKTALEEKITQLNKQPAQPAAGGSAETSTANSSTASSGSSENAPTTATGGVDEKYWGSVLKDKASLEVEVEKIKKQLSESSIETVEIKQKNADLQIKLDELQKDKENIDDQLKYKEEMINKLSIDLAHTKNEKKFVETKSEKAQEDNADLRTQIKKLVATKGALEKSIVRLSQDKQDTEKKLSETEGVIQGKIDEIWEIKKSLDDTMKSTSFTPPSKDVELPPIVVSSEGSAVSPESAATTATGFNGQIVSINNDNNFVIVNIGENSGVQLGDVLSVYRDSKYIARLEVIQVRKDIAAADIKDQWTKIQVGDAVK